MKKIIIGFIAIVILVIVGLVSYFGYVELIQEPNRKNEFNDELVNYTNQTISDFEQLSIDLNEVSTEEEYLNAYSDFVDLANVNLANVRNVETSNENELSFKNSVEEYLADLISINDTYVKDQLAGLLFGEYSSIEEAEASINPIRDEYLREIEELDNNLQGAQNEFEMN